MAPAANVVHGTPNDDPIQGTEHDDIIYGKEGDDEIAGLNGDDILYGGSGDDQMTGNNGNDIMYGGAGNDLMGGGNGDDAFYGGSGDDVFYSGRGVDHFDGGDGEDWVLFGSVSSGERVRIDLEKGFARRLDNGDRDIFNRESMAGDDTLISIENVRGGQGKDIIIGSSANNSINGKEGRDRLLGQDGDDTIVDGEGVDQIYGGAGADVFVLVSDGDLDRVRDFRPTEGDLLDISDWNFASDFGLDDLTIVQRAKNGEFIDGQFLITYQDEALRIGSHDISDANAFTEDMFIF